MEGLDRLKTIEENADYLFPSCTQITFREYRMARTRYFKTIDEFNFYKTFYSEKNVNWFILKGFQYFSICTNPGSIQDIKYYGKVEL
jgi:hypothetical protein